MGFLFPLVSDLSETQYRLVVVFQSITVKHAETAIPAVDDADVAEAAAVVASTLETAGKGIIYEHQAASVPAQRLSTELRRVVDDLIRQNSTQQSRVERDSAAALRRVERGARTAAAALAGDEQPVYLKLLGRVLGAQDSGQPGPPDQGSLIVQP